MKVKASPRQLLGVDALGAVVSAFLILGILIPFQSYIGLLDFYLRTLGIGAIGLAVFSGSCYWFAKKNLGRWLRIIGLMNATYMLLTFYFLWINWQEITWIGWSYFSAEAAIVALLISLELSMAETRP